MIHQLAYDDQITLHMTCENDDDYDIYQVRSGHTPIVLRENQMLNVENTLNLSAHLNSEAQTLQFKNQKMTFITDELGFSVCREAKIELSQKKEKEKNILDENNNNIIDEQSSEDDDDADGGLENHLLEKIAINNGLREKKSSKEKMVKKIN
jgi:hypothetical protein